MIGKSNIGERIKNTTGGLQLDTFTAGATGDNTLYTGDAVDRMGFGSCQVQMNSTLTLASGETFKNTINIYDCATSGGTYTLFSNLLNAGTIATGTATGGKYASRYNVDLSGAKRYIKIDSKADLSASGTDTAKYLLQLVLGGADVTPIS